MKDYKWIPQERLDAFVEEHNSDPNQICKIHSIQTCRIMPMQQQVADQELEGAKPTTFKKDNKDN